MWIFSNEDVAKMITIRECMAVLEDLYRDMGRGQALFMPRVDNIMPCGHDNAYYAFKHMGGGWPRRKIMALRINSDVITHPTVEGALRRVKVPKAGGRWVGLVQLYSSETGELLALFPDGVLQRMRVGATNGLGVKYLARKDARRAAIIGSGWQAGAQIMALLEAAPIEEIRVFSPQKEHRDAFAAEMSETTSACRDQCAPMPMSTGITMMPIPARSAGRRENVRRRTTPVWRLAMSRVYFGDFMRTGRG